MHPLCVPAWPLFQMQQVVDLRAQLVLQEDEQQQMMLRLQQKYSGMVHELSEQVSDGSALVRVNCVSEYLLFSGWGWIWGGMSCLEGVLFMAIYYFISYCL